MLDDRTRTELPTASPPSEEPASEAAPETMEAKYRIDRVIASGGMGVVLAATHRHLGTRVAIKLLHDSHPSFRQRFLREARLASSLESPFIARVRDYGFTADGQPYLVMDYLEGRTLKARIEQGPLPLADALRFARELALALVEVHRAGIIHRDVKPSNVLLSPDEQGIERAKLIDFGIAKRMEAREGSLSEHDLTGSGEIVGTLAYMAPEQIIGHEVDQRADVFALGLVLYEMTSGRRAFHVESRRQSLTLAAGRSHEAFEPVPGLPVDVEQLLLRCLALHPDQRMGSAREVIDALPLLSTSSMSLALPTSSAQVSRADAPLPFVSRHRRWIISAVIGAVAAVLAAVVALSTSKVTAPPERDAASSEVAATSAPTTTETAAPDPSSPETATAPPAGSAHVTPAATAGLTGRRYPSGARPGTAPSSRVRFDERH